MILFFHCVVFVMQAEDKTYGLLGSGQGLMGKNVLQMMQLEDGRIVVDTESYVCFWDGKTFQCVLRDSTDYSPMPIYREYTRLLVDRKHRLWIKDTGKVACLNLETMHFMPECTALIGYPDDFYVDKDKDVWIVKDGRIYRDCDGLTFELPDCLGRVQEVERDSLNAYVFTNDGAISIFNLKDGRLSGSYRAYDEHTAKTLDKFSQVVQGPDGLYYQLRMGLGHAVMLSFDPITNEWNKYLDVEYALHTLIITPERKAYISCARGYWVIDLQTGEQHLLTRLHLPDGMTVQTGFNTILQDRDGGIWLGSYNDGILYSSSGIDLFETFEKNMLWVGILLFTVVVAGIAIAIKKNVILKRKNASFSMPVGLENDSSQEMALIVRARQLVEDNISNTDYRVEQLSRDLCMERSGLYKKMTALIQVSPVEFMRTIRLEYAARLLKEGERTITEVSEMTGFSSPKYFSTCFQQHYGCRPSLYKQSEKVT